MASRDVTYVRKAEAKTYYWSTEDEYAVIAAKALGFDPEMQFVEVAVAPSGHIVVRYTVGKPEEITALAVAVREVGWCWQYIPDSRKPADMQPVTIDDLTLMDMHFDLGYFSASEFPAWAADRCAASRRQAEDQTKINATVRAAALNTQVRA